MKLLTLTLAVTSLLLAGCSTPESKAEKIFAKAQKRVALQDTAAALSTLRKSLEVSEYNLNNLKLYTDLMVAGTITGDNIVYYESLDDTLLRVIFRFGEKYPSLFFHNHQKNSKSLIEYYSNSPCDSSTAEKAYNSFISPRYSQNSSSEWTHAEGLYSILRNPKILGISTQAEIEIFTNFAFRTIDQEIQYVEMVPETGQEAVILKLIAEGKLKSFIHYLNTSSFEELREGMKSHKEALKEIQREVDKINPNFRVVMIPSDGEREFLRTVIIHEFEKFVIDNIDSLPKLKEAVESASDTIPYWDRYKEL